MVRTLNKFRTRQMALIMGSIFLAAIWYCPAALAQKESQKEFVTLGLKEISGQDIPGAKQQAVSQALEKAVEHAVASLIPGQAMAASLEFIHDHILADTDKFIITYKVLGGTSYGGNYLVSVESQVSLNLLEERLTKARLINTEHSTPSLLFLIAEQTSQEILPRYWWGRNPEPYHSAAESILLNTLAEKRFRSVLEPDQHPDPANYKVEFTTIYDEQAAINLGEALDADMVIIGRVKSSESINRMGDQRAFDGMVEINAYDVKSGTLAFQFGVKEAATSTMEDEGNSQAIDKAAQTASQNLIERLNQFWSKTQRKENGFELALEGEDFLNRFIALKRRFKDMSDIENMVPKEIGSSSAVMEIIYKGSTTQFADTLMLKTFDDFGLEILAVTPDKVSIRFIEQDPIVPETSGTFPETPESSEPSPVTGQSLDE